MKNSIAFFLILATLGCYNSPSPSNYKASQIDNNSKLADSLLQIYPVASISKYIKTKTYFQKVILSVNGIKEDEIRSGWYQQKKIFVKSDGNYLELRCSEKIGKLLIERLEGSIKLSEARLPYYILCDSLHWVKTNDNHFDIFEGKVKEVFYLGELSKEKFFK